MQPEPATPFTPSRYNFAFGDGGPSADTHVVFNASTGAVIRLEGGDAIPLVAGLADPAQCFAAEAFDENTFARLRRGGFLVPRGTDEVAMIRDRFRAARAETPAVLTITTTMDCNLGCYYCYEDRSRTALATSDIVALLDLVRTTVVATGRRSLHVDWYGGEPLLNIAFIADASVALQAFCADQGLRYTASIISNGTLWPDDPAGFAVAHKLHQIQISFDGMQRNHDKRRRLRKGFGYAEGSDSSFDRAVALVDALVPVARVDLRFNTDRGNRDDLLAFVDFAVARGWFSGPRPAVFQPARLAAYTPKSQFMRGAELTLAEFDAARAAVRARLATIAVVEESEVPDGFPHPRTSVCAALADASMVVGADKRLYRCGLQVGETPRAVAALDAPDEPGPDSGWWSAFDPTTLPTCSKCSFLPICWGGCPKKHLDRDAHAIAEQGRYWRTNLPRLIATAAGFAHTPWPAELTEAAQFRIADPVGTVDATALAMSGG